MKGDGWFRTIFLYYLQWDKGFLPNKGGINDQPAKFAETMSTLRVILHQVDEANRPPKPS